jgi:hypothetical protein
VHNRICLFFPAIAAMTLLACTTETTTSASPATAAPDPGADPPAVDPPTSNPPAKPPSSALTPPAVKVDATFAGGAGIVDGSNEIQAMSPGPNGSTFVALRKAGGSLGWGNGTLLRRYLANGTLDASFATGGQLDTKRVANPGGLGVDASGNALVGGTGFYDSDVAVSPDAGNEVVVLRVTPAGVIDPTYGSGGRATLAGFSRANVWTTALRVRSDGGAYVAVYGRSNGKDAYGDFLVGPTGSAVTGYGTSGFVGSAYATDGAVVLGEDVAVPSDGGLARFGKDGAAKGNAIDDVVAMAKVAKDGSFVALASDGTTLALVHYSAAGVRDKAFVSAPLSDSLTDYEPLPDGSVLVADGADLAWVSAKGGAPVVVVKGAAPAKLTTTPDGKVLAMTAGSKPSIVRYTF